MCPNSPELEPNPPGQISVALRIRMAVEAMVEAQRAQGAMAEAQKARLAVARKEQSAKACLEAKRAALVVAVASAST